MSIVLEQELVHRIEELAEREQRTPSEIVADALDAYKSQQPKRSEEKMSDIEFLSAIVGLGESDEEDIAERDEEILASGIDPLRGWHVEENSRRDNS
jgi:predicted transcriptional regulator